MTYRANQLLTAAATKRTFTPVTPEQQAWFDRLDLVMRGSSSEVYARLLKPQPALAEVDSLMQDYRTDPDIVILHSPVGPDKRIAIREQLHRALEPLVGPAAHTPEPLLRSHRSYAAAYQYIVPKVADFGGADVSVRGRVLAGPRRTTNVGVDRRRRNPLHSTVDHPIGTIASTVDLLGRPPATLMRTAKPL